MITNDNFMKFQFVHQYKLIQAENYTFREGKYTCHERADECQHEIVDIITTIEAQCE